ncbi:MAG: VWA domain-containing protein, partial [Acidobacteria bacterium]|nr:VWA domain-containing protein [Acidobacteriota bacterium]
TAVRAIVVVPLSEAPGRSFDGQLTHNFLVHGEIIREGSLFESFEYRFEGPTADGASEIPIGFTRYLRPGPVTLRILLEDVYGNRFSQIVREIDIRSPDGLEPIPVPDLTALTGGGIREGERSLQLLSPSGGIQVGLIRFRTRHFGEFDRVAFFLDDKQVISKRRPPYSVEIDLGETPAPHRVRVVGIVAGLEVSTDQIWLNQGAQRFRVRIIEPRPGGIYPGSLTARAEVQTPDGQAPERVELWVNDERLASLVEPPYSLSLRLPSREVAVVRAVAYLADGSVAEDAIVVNASGFGEEVRVQLVEIHALVLDDDGRPVAGLGQDRFTVFENDQPQEILSFEESIGIRLQAVLLVDRSASMEPHLDRVIESTLAFSEQALASAEDRIAVLSFADTSSVDKDFTASSGQVERALAALVANGLTALYDGIVQALNYFSGTPGEGALLLFSDGRDEASRMSAELTIETAKRAGVVIYTVGLEDGFPDRDSRRALETLATETGGRAFFLADLENLTDIYDQIHQELRSRYQIVYRPPGSDAGYRAIRVEVEGRGLEVRARKGYYP